MATQEQNDRASYRAHLDRLWSWIIVHDADNPPASEQRRLLDVALANGLINHREHDDMVMRVPFGPLDAQRGRQQRG